MQNAINEKPNTNNRKNIPQQNIRRTDLTMYKLKFIP